MTSKQVNLQTLNLIRKLNHYKYLYSYILMHIIYIYIHMYIHIGIIFISTYAWAYVYLIWLSFPARSKVIARKSNIKKKNILKRQKSKRN